MYQYTQLLYINVCNVKMFSMHLNFLSLHDMDVDFQQLNCNVIKGTLWITNTHLNNILSSVVGLGSSTLNHGGDSLLLQHSPSHCSPSQRGSVEYKWSKMYVFVGLPDSQYWLSPRKEGITTLLGLLGSAQGQLHYTQLRPSDKPATYDQNMVTRCSMSDADSIDVGWIKRVGGCVIKCICAPILVSDDSFHIHSCKADYNY